MIALSPMPLYEYRCQACAQTFELLRPIAERTLQAVCPSCESATTMPLISRVAAGPSTAPWREAAPAPRGAAGGGCCGGACGCG
jgi:putative FmdB family regulatory protein